MERIARLSLFFFAIFVVSANADNEHRHQHHKAHVHGAAILNITLASPQLLIELETPAMNVLGFEHAPRTDAQLNMLTKAQATLSDAASVIKLNHGNCSLTSVDVKSPEFPAADNGAEPHQHGGHENHDKHENKEEGHSEFYASYLFTCSDVQKLESIEVQVFNTFPGFKAINAQWVSDSGQGAQKLTPSASFIKLR